MHEDVQLLVVLMRVINPQEFLESEGILVNDPEPMPVDPYTLHRAPPQRSYISPSNFDHQKQFLTMDRKVTTTSTVNSCLRKFLLLTYTTVVPLFSWKYDDLSLTDPPYLP